MRQKLLAIPARVSRKCAGKPMAEIHKILTDAVIVALQEITDLPKAGMDPNWESQEQRNDKKPRAKLRSKKG
jgi:hypothetical protein